MTDKLVMSVGKYYVNGHMNKLLCVHRYESNKFLVTGDGDKASMVYIVDDNGKYGYHNDVKLYNLMSEYLEPIIVTGWVNVYKVQDQIATTDMSIYPQKQLAKDCGMHLPGYINTVFIEANSND